MELVLFPIALIFAFFVLYVLSKNDFVFLRKNVTLHNMFDVMILSLIGFFIFSRITYVFGGVHSELYSPIAVLHFIRYPGMLFLGGVVGFTGVCFLFFRKKKILPHIQDVYFLSLYPLFLLAMVTSNFKGNFLYFNIFIFLLSITLFSLGIYSYRNILLKDGSISLLFLCLFAIFTIINEFSGGSRILFSTFSIPQVISIIVFIACAVLLLIYESMISIKRK